MRQRTLVAGDVEVLADEAHVAAFGCLGAIGVAEDPLVGFPVAVAITGGGHTGCSLGARAVGAGGQRNHHLEATVVDHAGRVVECRSIDLDERAGRRAEGLDARSVKLAVDDLLALGQQQDKVAGTQIELAGAVILQAVELRVVAVAPTQLEGTATVHEQAERVGAFDLLELGRRGHVLAALGNGRGGKRLDQAGQSS